MLALLRKEAACARASRQVLQGSTLSGAQAEMVEAALAVAAEGGPAAEAALSECLQVRIYW